MAKNEFTEKTFLYSKEKVPHLSKVLKGQKYVIHHIGKSDAKRQKFIKANETQSLGILTNLLNFYDSDFCYVCEVDEIEDKFITSFVLSEKFDAIYQCKSKADDLFIKECSDSAFFSAYIDECVRENGRHLESLLENVGQFNDELLSFIVEERLKFVVESLMYDQAYEDKLLSVLNAKLRIFPSVQS
jgi:hypothetical protein